MPRVPKSARHSPGILIGFALAWAVVEIRPPLARSESPAAPAPAEVLATFEGGQITRDDYERVLAHKLPNERDRIAKPGGREALLESLIRYDLLAEEAERRGYGRRLEVTLGVERAASDRMVESVIRVEPTAVPAEDVASAYSERSREFLRPAMRRATQIRVATEREANALSAQLKGAGREQFAQIAREKNIDPRTRNQGGELGYFDREGNTDSGRPTGVPAELVNATFKLRKVGEVSKPIAQDDSWSVLMFTGEMAPFTKSRAEAEPELREKRALQLTQIALDKFVAELHAKYAPEIQPELIDAVVLPAAAPLDIPEGFAAAPPDPRAPPIQIEPDGI
jgi:peptidyl-prolyl cis-trans isomerase C